MRVKNEWWWWESALTPEKCQDIIDLGDGILQKDKENGVDTTALTGAERRYAGDIDKEKLYQVRKCDVAWFNDQWVYELVHPFVNEANRNAGWNYEWDFSEDFQYTVYPKGGFYGWHTDQGMSCSFGRYKYDDHNFDEHKESLQSTIAPCIIENPTNLVDLHNKIRKLSVTLTLSEPDEYTGGNLEFDEGEFGRSTKTNRYTELTQIRPQGSIVVFPSYQWHQIKEVKSGIRKSLVLWSCGPPFR